MEAETQNEKEIGDEKNRDAEVLEWFYAILNDGGIYSHSDGNCRHCDPHLIFDEVKKWMSKSARGCILLAKGYRE